MKGYVFWTSNMSYRSRKIMRISSEEKDAVFEALD